MSENPTEQEASELDVSCQEDSISEELRTYSLSSRSIDIYEALPPQTAARLLGREHQQPEPRRHSTPVPESKNVQHEAGGRRFTTIPVTSEGSVRGKVAGFFIGSPPDSPPRVKSNTTTSSSDSGSGGEHRKSLGSSSSDSVSVGSKRDSADSSRDKGTTKIMKLSINSQMKENVDPRNIEELVKVICLPGRRGNLVSTNF